MIIPLFSESLASKSFLKQKTNERPANRWAFFVRGGRVIPAKNALHMIKKSND